MSTTTSQKVRKPPKHLSRAAREWWLKISSTWQLDEHHMELLNAAAGCLDRIETARKIVDAEGAIIQDRFGIAREHPASKIERDQKILLAKLLRELSLDPDPPADSRPPLIPNRYER